MRIRCPACSTMYRIPDERVPPQGARATCKACGTRIDIPPPGSVPLPPSSLRTGAGVSDLPGDRQALDDLLLLHQNSLANLRTQARQATPAVPFYVLNGIEHELAEIRRIQEALASLGGGAWARIDRLPEPGENAGEARDISRFPLLIGRASVCDWRLDNPQISQLHGRLLSIDGEVCYQDLGSTNGGAIVRGGTLLQRFESRADGDGDVVHPPVPLRERDLLYVANTRMVIETIGWSSEAAPHPEQDAPYAAFDASAGEPAEARTGFAAPAWGPTRP